MDKNGEELDKAIGKSLEDSEFFISQMQEMILESISNRKSPSKQDFMIQYLLDATQLLLRKALEK